MTIAITGVVGGGNSRVDDFCLAVLDVAYMTAKATATSGGKRKESGRVLFFAPTIQRGML